MERAEIIYYFFAFKFYNSYLITETKIITPSDTTDTIFRWGRKTNLKESEVSRVPLM